MSLPDEAGGMLWVTAIGIGALLIGSVVRIVSAGRAPGSKASERFASLASWWVIAILVLAAVWTGPWGMLLLMAVITALSIWEFLTLPLQPSVPQGFLWTIPAVWLLAFAGLSAGWIAVFRVGVPLACLVLPSAVCILTGHTRYSTTAIGEVTMAGLLLVYALGHAALLAVLSPANNPVAGVGGWFLFLVALTQINDICQALVGRALGRRRLTSVSPGKTWEGFAGGLGLTVLISIPLGWLLTPLGVGAAAGAGLLIAVAGLLGDLNMSLIKRDAGVKASGTMVPGQGGILDRVDSLSFTAPAFYYYLVFAVT